jgi:hypothetical protein
MEEARSDSYLCRCRWRGIGLHTCVRLPWGVSAPPRQTGLQRVKRGELDAVHVRAGCRKAYE